MKIQETFEDIISWGNFVLSLKTNSEKENTHKDKENDKNDTESWTHEWGTWNREKKLFVLLPHRRCMPLRARCMRFQENASFCCIFSTSLKRKKNPSFSPDTARNFPRNTRVLIHKFSFRTWRFRRIASAWSINKDSIVNLFS